MVLNLQTRLDGFPMVDRWALDHVHAQTCWDRKSPLVQTFADSSIDFVDLLSLQLMNYSSLLIISPAQTEASVCSN